MTVIAPSEGERWETGSTRNICWKAMPDSNEIKLESFALEIWEGATMVERLVDRARLSAGEQPSFEWTVSEKLNSGSKYRIRVKVWDEVGHSGEGFSGVFAIALNPLLHATVSSIEQAHPKLPIVDQAPQVEPVQESKKLIEELPAKREPWSWIKLTRLKIQVAFFSLALLLVIGAAIYFGFRPTELKKPVVIEQLNPITERLHDAIIKGDASALASLYTEDAIMLSDQGASYGREAIEKHWADVFTQLKFVDQHDATDQNSPHSLGTAGNEAWSNGQWRSSFQMYGGSPLHANGVWLKIYRREGDTWKISADVGFTVR